MKACFAQEGRKRGGGCARRYATIGMREVDWFDQFPKEVRVGQSDEKTEVKLPVFADYDLLGTLSHLLRRSHFHAEALFAQMLGGYGVTSRQLALLVAVAQNPGAVQRTLGEIVALDTNTISDLLRRMEKRGLIERRSSSVDGRSVEIHLSSTGAEILVAIQNDNRRYQEALSESLSDEERQELKSLLKKLLRL